MTLVYTFRDGTTTTDVITWAKKYEDSDYRRVGYDRLNEVVVSTIWQGMPSIGGEPNTYETKVFHNMTVLYEERWHTEEEAVAGHEKAARQYIYGDKENPDG